MHDPFVHRKKNPGTVSQDKFFFWGQGAHSLTAIAIKAKWYNTIQICRRILGTWQGYPKKQLYITL